jgi:hypothetical protein
MITTQIANTVWDSKELCGERECYPIIGSLLSRVEAERCFKVFYERKLKRSWDCINKAIITANLLENEARGKMEVHIGSCYVFSEEVVSSYGYAYNPPLEIHAWAFSMKQGAIYDLAMPGVVLSGKELEDEIGPYIGSDIQPVIIAIPVADLPKNFKYSVAERRDKNGLSIL